MSTLTTKQRNSLPPGKFGIIDRRGKGHFPVNDPAHAANAKARATQMVNAGKLSPSAKAQIDAKANRILNKGK